MNEDFSAYADLQARRQRLVAFQRARGMSAVAASRLLRPCTMPEPFLLRPVLATGDDVALGEVRQAAAKRKPLGRHPKKGMATKADIKGEPIPRHVTPAYGVLDVTRRARVKAIASEVARVVGADASQILANRSPRRYAACKHMATYLAAKLTDVGTTRLSPIFGYGDHTSTRYAIQKVAFGLRMGTPAAVELHAKAVAAIRARWPEYDAKDATP